MGVSGKNDVFVLELDFSDFQSTGCDHHVNCSWVCRSNSPFRGTALTFSARISVNRNCTWIKRIIRHKRLPPNDFLRPDRRWMRWRHVLIREMPTEKKSYEIFSSFRFPWNMASGAYQFREIIEWRNVTHPRPKCGLVGEGPKRWSLLVTFPHKQLKPRWVYITYRFSPCNIRTAYANDAIKGITITSREILFSGLTAELRFAGVLEAAEDEQRQAMERQLKLCLIDIKFERRDLGEHLLLIHKSTSWS